MDQNVKTEEKKLSKAVVITLSITGIFYLPLVALLIYVFVKKGARSFKKWYMYLIAFFVIMPLVATLTTPPVITEKTTYTVEEVPSVPEQEGEEYEFTIGEVIVCGEQVPLGEYVYNAYGTNSMTTEPAGSSIGELQEYGMGEMEGSYLSQGEKVNCDEGMQIRTYNDNGTFTLTGLPTPAKPAIPAFEVTEIMTYSPSIEEYTCTSNNNENQISEEVNCEDLVNYEELLEKVKSQIE